MSGAWRALTAVTALACAASGGALATYSGVTVTALRRLPAAQGMAAMQQVNLAAPRSASLMALLFVPGAASLVLLARAVVDRGAPRPGLVVAGAAVYLLGVVGTTVAFSVPRNAALAGLDAASQHDAWQPWLQAWVRSNHVRTVSGLLAAGLLALSVR